MQEMNEKKNLSKYARACMNQNWNKLAANDSCENDDDGNGNDKSGNSGRGTAYDDDDDEHGDDAWFYYSMKIAIRRVHFTNNKLYSTVRRKEYARLQNYSHDPNGISSGSTESFAIPFSLARSLFFISFLHRFSSFCWFYAYACKYIHSI